MKLLRREFATRSRSARVMSFILIPMSLPDPIIENLKTIEAAVDAPLPALTTDQAFMLVAVKLTDYAQYFLNLAVSLAGSQFQAEMGFTKRRAIIMGHVVRIKKLYDAFRYHASRHERDICSIFVRPLFEAVVKAQYLMNAKSAGSFRNFVLISYRPEKEMLADLKKKAALRPLIEIEKRMMRRIKKHLKEDRVSVKALTANRNWNLDGKDMRQLLDALGHQSGGYAYLYGTSSHWLHGDWYDLRIHHLKKTSGRYTPKWQYTESDPRVLCPMTIICLAFVDNFLSWNHSDPDRFVRSVLKKTVNAISRLDEAHELSLHR